MRGHADSVTGLSLSSEGSYLLSNAMDNTGNFVKESILKFPVIAGHKESRPWVLEVCAGIHEGPRKEGSSQIFTRAIRRTRNRKSFEERDGQRARTLVPEMPSNP